MEASLNTRGDAAWVYSVCSLSPAPAAPPPTPHLAVVLDVLLQQLQLLLLFRQRFLLTLQFRAGVTEYVNFLLSYFLFLERK